MEKQFLCPRRSESSFGASPMFARDNDWDPSDDTCRYCGSLAPDTFMARCEAGDIALGTTDKSYKVYVHGLPNPLFGAKRMVSKINFDPERSPVSGEWLKVTADNIDTLPWGGWTRPRPGEDCWVLLGDETPTKTRKFYFQHLDAEQRTRFVEMMNEPGKLKFEGGYGFYVMPFFAQRVAAATDTVQ